MRFNFWQFNFNSYKVNLAVIFAFIAFVVLFSWLIIKLIAVIAIGFLGWVIGSVLDDRPLLNRIKYTLRNVFSRR
jgi:chromate transport protein ChrA